MGVLQGIADVILIFAALFSLIAFAFIGYTALMIYRMAKDVRTEVGELTGAAKDSLNEATDTGRFVSESIVKPASTAMGFATAIRATLKAISEDITKKSRT